MTELLTELPEFVEIWVKCTGCDGKGQVTERNQVITEAAMPKHMRDHAYSKDDKGNWIGANCDCPRRPSIKKHACIGCAGAGEVLKQLRLPSPGSKVVVIDQKLLTSIFGAGDVPADPGVVYDVQTPEQHGMELRTGFGVRVSWDRLNKNGTIPKGKQVDLWTFDLTELRIA